MFILYYYLVQWSSITSGLIVNWLKGFDKIVYVLAFCLRAPHLLSSPLFSSPLSLSLSRLIHSHTYCCSPSIFHILLVWLCSWYVYRLSFVWKHLYEVDRVPYRYVIHFNSIIVTSHIFQSYLFVSLHVTNAIECWTCDSYMMIFKFFFIQITKYASRVSFKKSCDL